MKKFMIAAVLIIGTATSVAAQDCDKVLDDYVFCSEGEWQIPDLEFPEGMILWQKGDITGKLLIEVTAADLDINTEIVLDAIKDSVRNSLSDPSTATFKDQAFVDVQDKSLGTISYDLQLDDTTLQMNHSVMVSGNRIMQYVTATTGDDYAAGIEAHQDFLSRFKAVEPNYDT